MIKGEMRNTFTDPTERPEEREELINIVGEYNEFSRELLRKKTLGKEIGGCELEKEGSWRKLK